MVAVEALPETATFSEFASILRCRRSWVTQLRKDDRLVLAGRRVRVAESMRRIEATDDPSAAATVARHAEQRGGDLRGAPSMPGEVEAAVDTAPVANDRGSYQYWRARREQANALATERDNSLADGRLVPADELAAVMEDAATAFRAATENAVLELTPRLAAEADEGRTRAIITEHFHDMLVGLGKAFARAARAGGA